MLEALKAPLRPLVHAIRARFRTRELARTLPPVTPASLVAQIDALALPEAPVFVAHTAMKQLGFVEGGAAGVVDALIDAIVIRRRGTLMLPAFSIDGSMQGTLAQPDRVFDVRTTPSNLGAIPEAFRQRAGVRRSIHPTHSFAALGPRAEWLTASHHEGPSFGPASPMMRARDLGGVLAGLGTHLGTVTFYHCLEDSEPDFPISVYAEAGPYAAQAIGWNGERHDLMLPAHAPAIAATRIDHQAGEGIRAFFQQQLEREAGLSWFPIGHGRGWHVPMAAMYAECLRLMRAGVTIYSAPPSSSPLPREA